MKLHRIKLKSVLGIEDIDIAPGKVTGLEGGNAQGKTTIIKAIQSVVKGGHDATLVRNGASEAEIVLVVEEDGDILTFRDRITPEGHKLAARDQNGEDVPRPKETLERLFDALQANPVEFIRGDAKKRLRWLLDTLPLTVTDKELAEATGKPVRMGAEKQHALVAIDALQDALYKERTEENREVKTKTVHLDSLERGIPPDQDADAPADLETMRRQVETLGQTKWKQLTAIEKAFQDSVETHRSLRDDVIAAAHKAFEVGVAEERRQRDEAVAKVNREYEQRSSATEAALAKAEQALKENERVAHLREMAAATRLELDAAKAKVSELNNALEGLAKLRLKLLSRLPIPHLELKGNDIYLDGIIFDQINTAEQWKLAIKVACLRGNGIVCLDGLECFDSANMATFEKVAKHHFKDTQFIYTRVTDGPLKVKTEESK